MSQRDSGYERKERDCYETPEWVTDVLCFNIPAPLSIWEPACGSGKMVRALERAGHKVRATDIETGTDFLNETMRADWIVTNPPYEAAQRFIEHALTLAEHVAMLLRTDFDHAKSRQHLFGKGFAQKIVLTKRIRWFEDSTGSPSFNHAWFVWDHQHQGAPTLAYGP